MKRKIVSLSFLLLITNVFYFTVCFELSSVTNENATSSSSFILGSLNKGVFDAECLYVKSSPKQNNTIEYFLNNNKQYFTVNKSKVIKQATYLNQAIEWSHVIQKENGEKLIVYFSSNSEEHIDIHDISITKVVSI